MPLPTPEGWVRTRAEHPRGCIDILHPEHADGWVQVVELYQEGRLPGLERIRSSELTVVHRGTPQADGPTCYFKRFLNRGWSDLLKHLFRPTRASRALTAACVIESLGFHTAPPLCLVETRRRGWVTSSMLVTKEITNAPHIYDWMTRSDLGIAGRPLLKRKLIHALGTEVGKWHAQGLFHGDMGLGNILAKRSGEAYTFYWLDNERTRKMRRLRLGLRLQNLHQLNRHNVGMTTRDRQRFWEAYLRECPVSTADQRRVRRAFQTPAKAK